MCFPNWERKQSALIRGVKWLCVSCWSENEPKNKVQDICLLVLPLHNVYWNAGLCFVSIFRHPHVLAAHNYWSITIKFKWKIDLKLWRYILLESVLFELKYHDRNNLLEIATGLNPILVCKNKNTCLHMQMLLCDHDVTIGKICPCRYGVSSCTKQWTPHLNLSLSILFEKCANHTNN